MPLLRLERRAADQYTVTARPDRAGLVAVTQLRAARQARTADDRLAALGLRSLADLLAPSSLVISDDHLVLDGQYTRILAIGDLPPVVAAGWLNGVLAEQLAIDLSVHIRPAGRGRRGERTKTQELAAGWRAERRRGERSSPRQQPEHSPGADRTSSTGHGAPRNGAVFHRPLLAIACAYARRT